MIHKNHHTKKISMKITQESIKNSQFLISHHPKIKEKKKNESQRFTILITTGPSQPQIIEKNIKAIKV